MKRLTAGIAIVGIGCRLPGANSPAEFWRNLIEGREAVAFASDEELAAAGVDPALIENPDYVRAASRIEAPEYFDAAFFGFSGREAEIIDPQQRVFLECAFEALEEAGCDPSEYPGAIGVFAGAGMNTYGILNLLSRPEILASAGSYQAMVGNDKDFLCSRVAYKLNLNGPAVGVQTACSTSLVAVQMAFESLLRKECDVALAGGVSISLPQPLGYLYQPGMILSRDGHCRAFDAAASGTVPGAGAGVVVLKRLGDAIENGDHVYAVIRGAAINNDGAAKVGYSAPSVDGQHAVIRRSMEMAGFDPASVKYVEAHGTGTEVGDPIEFAALARAFESAAKLPGSCALGSLKTNIGHLDTAAGVAGLIKTALCVKNRILPPTLHFKDPNPLIDFGATPFYVNSTLVRYGDEQPLRAGVSSFGIGGTNVHLSLEEAPSSGDVNAVQGSQLIVLSAKSASALDRRMSQLLDYLEAAPAANLADIAYTLQTGRQRFQHRQALVARDVQHLAEQLRAGAQSTDLRKLRAEDALLDSLSVAFLFPGQGAQFVDMGRNLYESVPLFREIVDSCAQALQPLLGLDLRTVLYPSDAEEKQIAERLLNQTSITQPAIFTIEYAMARVWMQCGILPAAMIGHSVGEYVAACLAGVFSLEDALALIAERGRLIQSMPPGVMLAVTLSEQDLSPLLSRAVSIAGINSDTQTVASGPEERIAELEAVLSKKNILYKRLRTSHAFHSPMMDSIVEPFVEEVRKVRLSAPNLRYLSNVSGTWITADQAVDPAYWGAHLRSAVRFADCARNMLRESDWVLLEVGPGETLGSLIRAQARPNSKRTIVSSMRHALAPADDRDHWLGALAKLWLKNVRVDWKGLYAGERPMRVSLPTYPFERQRYWIEAAKTLPVSSQLAAPLKEPDIADWFYVPSWKRTLSGPVQKKTEEINKWLVFSENDDFSQQLSAELGDQGVVVQVRAGSKFQAVSPRSYEVSPDNREDYLSLTRDLITTETWPERIVYLWKPKLPDCGVSAAMSLVQALEEESSAAPVELNVVCDRAYSVFGEPISSPACSALNAFWRVATLECRNLKSRIIDVDLNSNKEVAVEHVLRELQHRTHHETIAYRGTGRWQQTYEPIRIEHLPTIRSSDRKIMLRPGGTYLITGGLGGVGLVLARHIARETQGRVVLTSRTPLPLESEWESLIVSPETSNEIKQKIEGLQSIIHAGGKVVTIQADVSDEAAMKRVLAEIHRQYGRVHGIIHAAGLAGAGMIQMKSQEQVLAILSPKVQGTEWLRDYLPAGGLDFVMLCSSIDAILPSFGISDYAAANAYLDGFAAAFDDPAGTRVLAVNWDTWREVGMAVNTALPSALAHLREDRLKHAIRPEEAEEVFDRLLEFPVSQIVVSTRDLASLQKMEADLEASVRTVVQAEHREQGSHGGQNGELSAAEDEVEAFIAGLWQELLGVDSVGINDNFFQLGGHSLMGTQVLSRVRERYRVSLPLRIVFEAATPAELAQRIRVMSWAMNPTDSGSDTEREEIEI
ncbi:MAG TPA: SDR family NAD(P)-dependent oxidoreductase [Bryobacteraceae bacterium]|nr:SDR family NAD(P)-dependent oxidoreductase [Bryobacteraceae bacterium]